jgi:hypothetical protein
MMIFTLITFWFLSNFSYFAGAAAGAGSLYLGFTSAATAWSSGQLYSLG